MDLPRTYSLVPDERLISTYTTRQGVFVAEIAGRDSVAAVIATVRDNAQGVSVVVPTAAFTGTEYGDPSAPQQAVDHLARTLPDVEFAPLTWVGDPRIWAALNGRFASAISARFGISSPCLACHLYMHLCRIPLARALGGAPVIAGERETHDGRIKYSQTALSIDICIEALASVGIELLEPLRHASGDDVTALLEGWRPDASAQLECVHSGNYADLDGEVALDEAAYQAYAEGFLRPAGRALAAMLAREETAADYREVVRDVLGAGGS